MNTLPQLLRVVGVVGLGCATQALAVTIHDLGAVALPSSLGGYTLVAAPADARPLDDLVTAAPLAGGGELQFDVAVEHLRIDDGWYGSWPGYAGDVYFAYGMDVLSLSLPSDVPAFTFYVQPDFRLTPLSFTLTVGLQSLDVDLDGAGGAYGFGLVAGPGESIPLITVVDNTGLEFGFAVGQFGQAGTPAPTVADSGNLAPLGVVALAALLALGRRRHRRG